MIHVEQGLIFLCEENGKVFLPVSPINSVHFSIIFPI